MHTDAYSAGRCLDKTGYQAAVITALRFFNNSRLYIGNMPERSSNTAITCLSLKQSNSRAPDLSF